MLNRIYIIVGVLAIIVLAGAFIAPRFIQWGDYRSRMEDLATGVLGTPVTIRGDISFSLLPQPSLNLADVLVGSPEEPAATVDRVEAEFSLMDFLRDNYNMTRLVLRGPVIDFTIDESGLFGSGVTIGGNEAGVSLGQASILDATVRLIDRRSGENYVAADVDGELRLSSFSGPFQFQGAADYRGGRYGVRLNSGLPDATGTARVSGFVQAEGFSFSLEGNLVPGMAPKFDGTMAYRQTPPAAEAADDIRGDLVLESKVTGSTDRIVMSGYTLQPDENRAGTRLTGAASIQLGMRRSFDAVISGGVFSLPPRDASEDPSTLPYEAVRLLSELPAPLLPPMPGRIGVDLSEIGLRGFSLRNVRLDASTDGTAWQIEQFIGELPGSTEVRGSGTLGMESSRPAFRGAFSMTSERLDGLAQLWRKPDEDNQLFGQTGNLSGNVMLVGDALGISGGQLTLNGRAHAVELRVGFGAEKRLDVIGHFDGLGVAGSAMLGALLPNAAADAAFGVSFPEGSFALTAKNARVFGLDGRDLVADGQWTQRRINFSRLSAAEWGGVGLDGSLEVIGAATEPAVSGSGRVSVADANAPALSRFYDALAVPVSWRVYMARSAPADLLVDLDPADDDGMQVLTLGGALGVADFGLRAELGAGVAELTSGQLRLTATLASEDVAGLTRQVGLGSEPLFDGDAMLVSIGLAGSPSNSLNSRLNASSGDERIGFAGELLTVGNGEIHGTGTLEIDLADAGGLAQTAGAQGLSLPMAQAQASLHFEGEQLARLTDITGSSGSTPFSGELAMSRTGSTTAISGNVAIETVSIEGLAATMFGRAALVGETGGWPDGPLDLGGQDRQTRGSVSVTAVSVTGGGQPRLGETTFDLTWDETRLRLARLEAVLGTGIAKLDLAVCCAGPLMDKTVSARLSLSGVAINDIATPAVAAKLDGMLEGGVRLEATGASIAELLSVLAGEGSFTLADFAVDQLAPRVFPTVAGLDDLINIEPDALEAIMSLALGQGQFSAPAATGTFTVAGGVARLNNFIVEGNGGRLAGDITLALPSNELTGGFVLTPFGFQDENGLVGSDTSRIITRIGGTLPAPEITLDLAEMAAAVQVRANELEVDRLEILRAEDAERQRAAAEARNRLIEEQRQRAAEEAARLAAEEAARLAAEEEERRLMEEQQQVDEPPPPAQTAPVQQLNLGYQPLVNQPSGTAVNQPL